MGFGGGDDWPDSDWSPLGLTLRRTGVKAIQSCGEIAPGDFGGEECAKWTVEGVWRAKRADVVAGAVGFVGEKAVTITTRDCQNKQIDSSQLNFLS